MEICVCLFKKTNKIYVRRVSFVASELVLSPLPDAPTKLTDSPENQKSSIMLKTISLAATRGERRGSGALKSITPR